MSINLVLIGQGRESICDLVQTPDSVTWEILGLYDVGQVERAMRVYGEFMKSRGFTAEDTERHIAKVCAFLAFAPGARLVAV